MAVRVRGDSNRLSKFEDYLNKKEKKILNSNMEKGKQSEPSSNVFSANE